MDRLRDYEVHFVGLKNGIHHLTYHIDSDFLKLFENPPFSDMNLTIQTTMDKKDSFFILHNQVDGTVKLPCDRCGDLFDYEMMFDFDVIIKLKDMEQTPGMDDDIVFIPRSATSFNLAQIFYDYIVVNVPIQVFHPNDQDGNPQCNPAILKILKKDELNKDDIDPRWEDLSKLKNKN